MLFRSTFEFGKNARRDVISKTTFDAVVNGERTSTTRVNKFADQAFKSVEPGHVIEFTSGDGRKVRVVVEDVLAVRLSKDDKSIVQVKSKVDGSWKEYGRDEWVAAWSRLEGWDRLWGDKYLFGKQRKTAVILFKPEQRAGQAAARPIS